MRVSASRKQLIAALIVAIAVLVILVAILIAGWVAARDDFTVQARVMGVRSTLDQAQGGDRSANLYHYAQVAYEVDGAAYTAQFRVLSASRYHAGDTIRVSCDPQNPGTIRNPQAVKWKLALAALVLLFILLDCKAIQIAGK